MCFKKQWYCNSRQIPCQTLWTILSISCWHQGWGLGDGTPRGLTRPTHRNRQPLWGPLDSATPLWNICLFLDLLTWCPDLCSSNWICPDVLFSRGSLIVVALEPLVGAWMWRWKGALLVWRLADKRLLWPWIFSEAEVGFQQGHMVRSDKTICWSASTAVGGWTEMKGRFEGGVRVQRILPPRVWREQIFWEIAASTLDWDLFLYVTFFSWNFCFEHLWISFDDSSMWWAMGILILLYAVDPVSSASLRSQSWEEQRRPWPLWGGLSITRLLFWHIDCKTQNVRLHFPRGL